MSATAPPPGPAPSSLPRANPLTDTSPRWPELVFGSMEMELTGFAPAGVCDQYPPGRRASPASNSCFLYCNDIKPPDSRLIRAERMPLSRVKTPSDSLTDTTDPAGAVDGASAMALGTQTADMSR